MNTPDLSFRRMNRRIYITILLGLAFLFSAPRIPAEEAVLWITSDIEGYLVGCDCPDGASAGLSAVARALEENAGPDDVVLDAGGFREPDRIDVLLEARMDEAALIAGYDGLIAVSSDIRDGAKAMKTREQAVPLGVAGAVETRRIMGGIPGESGAMILNGAAGGVAAVQWFGDDEIAVVERMDAVKLRIPEAGWLRGYLGEAGTAHHILVVRGSEADWDEWSGRSIDAGDADPSLVVFTGPRSPGYRLESGIVRGSLDGLNGGIPWVSIAARGNGVARIELTSEGMGAITGLELKRGISPESEEILALGHSYMEDLTARALKDSGRADARGGEILAADYWYPYGCRDCEDFLWNDIPAMERRSGSRVTVSEWDTGDADDFEALLGILEERGIELTSVPVLIVGDSVFQGDQVIHDGLEALLRGDGAAGGADRALHGRWEPGAVFLAGLLDGVNPCAFSAMVFLVSALALAGRSRKVMLAIGISYASGIFITYGLIGAGLLGGLRRIAVESGLRSLLEYVLAGVLVLLAVLSLVDARRLSRGRTDLILKLPEKLSKRVHGVIRNSVRSGAAAGGSFLLGAGVAIIELGCTGQVYLPTIAWMISRGGGATPWVWLIIYNAAFIIPLLIVFGISYKGVSAVDLAGVFKRRGAVVKHATAGLFAVLALVVIFA